MSSNPPSAPVPAPAYETPTGTPQSEQPPTKSAQSKPDQRKPRPAKQAQSSPGANTSTNAGSSKPNPKLRGHPRDSPETRLSKTLSWLLRHGAAGEGIPVRKDGFINVKTILAHEKLKSAGLDLPGLKRTVEADSKQRYTLVREPPLAATGEAVQSDSTGDELSAWWIRANQGHSLKEVEVELTPLLSAKDVPMAVHGTNRQAWQSISKQGLSKMKRNHIHLAQAIGSGVISGMRASSQILIYIDLEKALAAGIKFAVSANGVVLTEGDERGYLSPEFFERVEDAKGVAVTGWQKSA